MPWDFSQTAITFTVSQMQEPGSLSFERTVFARYFCVFKYIFFRDTL